MKRFGSAHRCAAQTQCLCRSQACYLACSERNGLSNRFKMSDNIERFSGAVEWHRTINKNNIWTLPRAWTWKSKAVIVWPCNNTVRRSTPPGGAAEIRWRWRSSPGEQRSAWLSMETLSLALDEWEKTKDWAAFLAFLQVLAWKQRDAVFKTLLSSLVFISRRFFRSGVHVF